MQGEAQSEKDRENSECIGCGCIKAGHLLRTPKTTMIKKGLKRKVTFCRDEKTLDRVCREYGMANNPATA
jgi:hypothetical protein